MSQPQDIPPSLAPETSTPPTRNDIASSVIQLREFDTVREEGPPVSAPADVPVWLAGRYQLHGRIGKGGMGEVFSGRDPDLGRDLALKVLLADTADHPGAVERFREEAQIGGQLQHPGVVPVYELRSLDDGRPYFTMKLVKGQTLAKLLSERGESANRAHFLKIFEQICQTVAYAHARGVLHRDLKPANVMVGAFGEVLVMDWGLAKVLARDGAARTELVPSAPQTRTAIRVSRSDAASDTREGDVLGTPAYMPPEQALGEVDRLDRRCDVFSLGAILCEILTGRPPYTGENGMAVLRKARRAELHEALARLDGCGADPELISLARRCLAVEREARPADAGEVAKAAENYLSGVEERARRAELERARAEVKAAEERKRRRLTTALAGAVLLLVLAGGGGAWRLQQQRAEASARQRETEQRAVIALERGRELLDQGWRENDQALLTAAGVEANRAEEIAARAGEAVREQAAAFQREVKDRQQRFEKNRALLAALLDVSEPRDTVWHSSDDGDRMAAQSQLSTDDQYVAAFRTWGLDVDQTPEQESVDRLRDQPGPVMQEIVAGLDSWMLHRHLKQRPEPQWRRLQSLADQLDRHEGRRQLRAAFAGEVPSRDQIVAGLTGALLPWTALCELERGPQWRWVLELCGRMDPTTDPVLSVVLLSRACRWLGAGVDAERVLRLGLVARGDQVILLDALGKLMSQQERWPEAIECFRAVRALRPGLGISLGRALVKAGRSAEGEAVLRTLAQRQPTNPDVHFHLGLALKEQQKLDEALAAYRQVIHLRPDDHLAYNNLGGVLAAQQKLDQAVAAFRKALHIAPDDPESHYNLGVILAAQQKSGEAVAAFRKAIHLKLDFSLAYSNLGGALHDQKKLDEAVAAYRQAIHLKPDDHVAYNYLGVALRDQKKSGEAVVAFRRAIQLKRDFRLAYYNLGVALYDQKKVDEAVVAYRRAIHLKPEDHLAHHALGVALKDQKKLDEAVAAFRQAHQLLPDHARYRDSLRSAERMLQVDRKLSAVLAGKERPADPLETVELGILAIYREQYHAAARFYTAALKADARLAENLVFPHQYNAGCVAVLAAAGKGKDAASLTEQERESLRRQALDWLQASLKANRALLDKGKDYRAFLSRRMNHWQNDADLASVRDENSLAALPEAERKQWQQLWADVAALLKKTQGDK